MSANATPPSNHVDPRVVMLSLAILGTLAVILFGQAPDRTTPKRTRTPRVAAADAIDSARGAIESGRPRRALSDAEIATIGPYVKGLVAGQKPDVSRLADGLRRTVDTPVYAVLRVAGKKVGSAWRTGPTIAAGIADAVRAARKGVDEAQRPAIDEVELALTHGYAPVDFRVGKSITSNRYRGITGIEFIADRRAERFAPSEMIEENYSFRKAMRAAGRRMRLTEDQMESPDVVTRTFRSDQVWVRLHKDPPEAVRMVRGNELVKIETLDRAAVQKLIDAQSTWMKNNLFDDGRLTYLYDPSDEKEPEDDNNMIRQWMGTIALGRIAKRTGDDVLVERVHQNITYNLERFYKEEPGPDGKTRGYIEFKGTSKLGAIALATMAIVEHPKRATFAAQEEAMLRTIDSLWDPGTGKFTGFYKPTGRDGAPNFYPGEALLLWATLAESHGRNDLVERIRKALDYYRPWHLDEKNRKPSFTPWQTQAYFKAWKLTKDPAFKEFIFEMNDWLLHMVQWEAVQDMPDLMGRYYNPDNTWFGNPHAASTGVYLEGLIDAHQLAKEVGDLERQEKYRQAMMRGIRSMYQLTYMDDIDMFFVEDRARLFGGVRSRTYSTVVRVDNVQHGLMGMMRIMDKFEDGDFKP